jgi:hypothetical protein
MTAGWVCSIKCEVFLSEPLIFGTITNKKVELIISCDFKRIGIDHRFDHFNIAL